MAELSYSSSAENVLNKFYGVDTIVYVEGIDDVPFWEFLFNKFTDYSVEISDVGGVPEVEKYIAKIEAGEITAIVACDADFSYIDRFSEHSNVIRSYGYSIENSLICDKTLKKVIKTIARVPMKSVVEGSIFQWLNMLESTTEKLVIQDIANHIMGEGKSVAGDNCAKFMKTKKSAEVCPRKIDQHLITIDLNVNKRLEEKIKSSIVESDRIEADFLRGHFLFSAALRYVTSEIKKLGRNVNVSNESFFACLLMAFESVFDENHNHYNYYKNVIGNTDVMS